MACGACTTNKIKETYAWTGSDGTKKVYSTEVEARAAVARRGGSYKKQ